MSSSFGSALAALKAHSTAVETVGHNLANVNTTGFKAVDVAFKDLVAENLRGGNGIGMGVGQPITVRNFNQGSIQASNGPLHAAIQGNGLFAVRDTAGNKLYTRDGSFQVDPSGAISTLTGQRVLSTTQKEIIVPSGRSDSKTTANMSVFANLNSNAAVGDTFDSAVEVVDSKGDNHVVTLTFTKTGADAWEMQASIPGEESSDTGATPGQPFELLTTQKEIIVPSGRSDSKTTANMSVFANLNSNAAVGDTFDSAVEVVDSKGDNHVVTLTFTKTGADAWEMQASIPGEESSDTGATPGQPFELLTTPVAITFDGTGKMTAPAVSAGTVDITAALNSANDLDLKLNLYDEAGAATFSQVAAASSTTRTVQDGMRGGELTGVAMADGGRVIARYDSGAEVELGRVGMVIVTDTRSLSDIGNNLFRAGGTEPEIGGPGEGGRGRIKGGSLEGSTVDMAREFTNLIVYQRGYQANSRVITTADELSQEVLNLKR